MSGEQFGPTTADTQYLPTVADSSGAFDASVPYIPRKIDVTFSIGTGNFGEGGFNVVTLRGYRVQATITKGAVGQQTVLNLRIWGMKLSQMQTVLTYGQKYTATRNNLVVVEAGDEIAGMTQVFYGNIYDAYFDGTAQPDVALQVTAYEGYVAAIKPAPPISIQGSADVAQMMRQLAGQTGAQFEDNSGVQSKLRDVYYPGTAYQQMRRIAEHTGINFTLENNVLAIWEKNKSRAAGNVPLFTPKNGMKDYPTFNQQGVIVTCLFRKVLLGGQKVGVKSQLFNGTDDEDSGDIWYYKVNTYTYTLESEMPNGPWFTTFQAQANPGD